MTCHPPGWNWVHRCYHKANDLAGGKLKLHSKEQVVSLKARLTLCNARGNVRYLFANRGNRWTGSLGQINSGRPFKPSLLWSGSPACCGRSVFFKQFSGGFPQGFAQVSQFSIHIHKNDQSWWRLRVDARITSPQGFSLGYLRLVCVRVGRCVYSWDP